MITRFTSVSDLPSLLRVPEVAAWTDTSTGAIYQAIRQGQLPHVKLGRLVRVPRSAVEAWVQVADRGRRASCPTRTST